MHIFLYGPPGSGKSTLGASLAASLDLPFVDLDRQIEAQTRQTIRQIFVDEGEPAFRQIEHSALRAACEQPPAVIALGGGALLDEQSRTEAESCGQVLLLEADIESLLERLGGGTATRPLLAGQPKEQLEKLLAVRKDHYASFLLRMDTSKGDVQSLARRAQTLLGAFRVRGMGEPYDARYQPGGLEQIGPHLRSRGLAGPAAVVTDSRVGPFYLKKTLALLEEAGYPAAGFCMPAGEAHKNLQTLQQVWDFFIHSEIERGSTVIALGGGVVGDLAGFAAATFLRGVAWVNVPTTLLAMVDSSLGGKTGLDLPQAKNLVGAFYPPRLTLADPHLLRSLPERELRSGLAEVLKHGVIADPDLFALCERGWQAVMENLDDIPRSAAVVKLRVIEADPYEKNGRQVLNLGHTVGHGVELASDFRLSHGEAVGIGMVVEARIGEAMGITETGLTKRIANALAGVGLPNTIPVGLTSERVVKAMRLDKKRVGGSPRFALPVQVGEVRHGVLVEDWQAAVMNALQYAEEK